MRNLSFFAITVGIFFLVACGRQVREIPVIADSVIKHARIYTVNGKQPWVEAAAIKSGRYFYIGDSLGVDKYIGTQTKVYDLGGKMAMPGINDAHLHPAMGGIKNLFECNFAFSATPDDIASTIAQCVTDNPDAKWIIGGQWTNDFFKNYSIDSPRKFLDLVSGDKAVLLSDDSTHNGWANSKALQLAGITKNTIDPADGKFERDVLTGEPNGILLESAEKIVHGFVPDWTEEQYQQAGLEVVRIGNQYGITGMKDAGSQIGAMAAFHTLDKKGMLNIHMATSIRTPYGHREEVLDYDRIDRLREQYKSTNVHTAFVKIFMDGIPTSSHTAAMIAPYKLLHPHDEATTGMLHLSPELLKLDMIELDKRGYTIKIHAAGDRSVRVSLDAIEAVREANGDSGLRHEVAHAGFIDAEDLPRFSKLQAVAEQSPYLWHPSAINDAIVAAVGMPRAGEYWPIRSLLESGAILAAGSDWPSVVPTMDPWMGIEAMVTRQEPRGNRPGSLWAEQAITLEQTLKIYTLNGADALRLSHKTGSVELGKSADLIVLNHNLFEIEAKYISKTEVQMTLFAGQVVYEKK